MKMVSGDKAAEQLRRNDELKAILKSKRGSGGRGGDGNTGITAALKRFAPIPKETNSLIRQLVETTKNSYSKFIEGQRDQQENASQNAIQLKDAIVDQLKDLGSNLNRTFQSYFGQITSPIRDILAPILMIGGTMWKIFKIMKNRKKEEGKGFFDQIKELLFNGVTVLGIAIGLIGGLIYEKIMAPFRIIEKGLSIFAGMFTEGGLFSKFGLWFKGIFAFIKESSIVTAGMEMGAGIMNGIKSVVGFFASIFRAIPFIEPLIAGLKVGFGWAEKIFWPLQIIMSLVDFISGFMATDGNILDKIMGGLKQVFKGLVEPFLTLGNWIGKFFGFDNLMKTIRDGIDQATWLPDWIRKNMVKMLDATGTTGVGDTSKAPASSGGGAPSSSGGATQVTPQGVSSGASSSFSGGNADMSTSMTSNQTGSTSVNTSAEARKWFDEASMTNKMLREWLASNGGGGGVGINNTSNSSSANTSAQNTEGIPTDVENFGILLLNKTWGLS